MKPPPTGERRAFPRSLNESKATGLIQQILTDPAKAADDLEHDIRTNGDVTMVSALLWAAESAAKLRGLDLKKEVAAIRRRLNAMGFDL